MTDNQRRRSPQSEPYRLTTSFPYLVRRVGLRIGELFDRRVAHLGITVSMYRVIAALSEANNQQLGQLAEMTSIELSTMSRLIGQMVRKGLVTRRRPERNGRIVEIALTEKAQGLALELRAIGAHYDEVAVAGLDAAAVELLKTQLRIAYQNLDRLEQELSATAARAKTKVRATTGAGARKGSGRRART